MVRRVTLGFLRVVKKYDDTILYGLSRLQAEIIVEKKSISVHRSAILAAKKPIISRYTHANLLLIRQAK